MSIPNVNWTSPESRVRVAAHWTLWAWDPQPSMIEAVRMERMAVGPRVMSLLVPKKV